MAFLDLDEIEQDSKDANIIPHPLRDKLAESEKAAYINAIVFAGLADDDTLSDIELEYGRTRALSLGLNADDFDDAVKTVQSLNGPKERKEFLFEMLAAFTDRTVAMYVLCDMAQAMASDGDLTDDAVKFLDSLYRLLLKSDKKPDNPLTPADQKFLTDYRPFLAPGKTADASNVIRTCQLSGFDCPVGLVSFFSPDLRPVMLDETMCGGSVVSICRNRFAVEKDIVISEKSHIMISDAEILFSKAGVLHFCGEMVVEIVGCRFVRKENLPEKFGEQYFITGGSGVRLIFKKCSFEGNDLCPAVLACDAEFSDCQFDRLHSVGNAIVDVEYRVNMIGSSFVNCQCSGEKCSVLKSRDIFVQWSRFLSCNSAGPLFMWRDEKFSVEESLFENCSSSVLVVDTNYVVGKWYFSKCCFENTKFRNVYATMSSHFNPGSISCVNDMAKADLMAVLNAHSGT